MTGAKTLFSHLFHLKNVQKIQFRALAKFFHTLLELLRFTHLIVCCFHLVIELFLVTYIKL